MSTEKIAELEEFHRFLRDKRQADCIKAVIASSKGWLATQIAEILLFDKKTSRNYFERYQQDGVPALLYDNYCGIEPKLDEHQMSELDEYLQEHLFSDAKSVIAHIYQQYNIRYSVSGVIDLLHRLGFSGMVQSHMPKGNTFQGSSMTKNSHNALLK